MNQTSVSPAQALQLATQAAVAGDPARAADICVQILRAMPDFAPALDTLLDIQQRRGRLQETATLLDELRQRWPDSFTLIAGRGQVAQALGDNKTAIDCYRAALQQRPDFADMHAVLGALLLLQGRDVEAVEALRNAIRLQTRATDAAGNLGIALVRTGAFAAAEPLLKQGVALNPHNALLHGHLGYALLKTGQPHEAIIALQTALNLQPEMPDTLNNLGVALNTMGRRAEAEAIFRRALLLQPDDIATLNNLARSLLALGNAAEAEVMAKRGLALQPNNDLFRSHLALALMNQGRQEAARAEIRALMRKLPDAPDVLTAILYSLVSDSEATPEEYLAVARHYGSAVNRLAQPFSVWRTGPAGSHADCLRVGLVSGDLRTHPVGYFLESIVAALDRTRVALIAYSTTRQEDALTARLRPHFAEWHNISESSDEAAAQRIHDDGIHVLIDLAGHTSNNRLPLFAWKPAPVQATWLGYSASSGVPAMDWILVDEMSVPTQARTLYTERPWYMQKTRVCFTPPTEAPAVSSLPAQANGFVTFGTFQNMFKLNDRVLAVWARVLHAVPSARLRVQNGEMDRSAAREQLLEKMAALGISRDRLTLIGRQPRADYLAAHSHVDLILDTFPYPGGTTTCEGLWMGVPTLTLAGRTLIERYGASVLHAIDLDDWIADSVDDYVARATAHACEIDALAAVRAGLRNRMQASPLCDGQRFARHFEDSLFGMWRETATSGSL